MTKHHRNRRVKIKFKIAIQCEQTRRQTKESKVMAVIPATHPQDKTTTSTMKHHYKDHRVCQASALGSRIVSERMKAKSNS